MPRLKDASESLAMSMFAFTWLYQHGRGEAYDDWERNLDELQERGFNAVRIDLFPHLVAAGEDGEIQEAFYCEKRDGKPAPWSVNCSGWIKPRACRCCKKRGATCYTR